MSVYTPNGRTALPIAAPAARIGTPAAPLAPGPVIVPGLVYGKADHVLAFWLYDLVGGDFSAEDVRSTPPPDDGRRLEHTARVAPTAPAAQTELAAAYR